MKTNAQITIDLGTHTSYSLIHSLHQSQKDRTWLHPNVIPPMHILSLFIAASMSSMYSSGAWPCKIRTRKTESFPKHQHHQQVD